MPDFLALIRQHLSDAKLPAEVEEELASHLNEVYEAECSAGSTDHEALETVRTHLGDPAQLLHAVRRFKGDRMRNFLRHVLVPGLFATVITTFAGNMLNVFRINHNFYPQTLLTRNYVWFFGPTTQWGSTGFVNVDLPLLFAYVFAGAFAAYISVRLGGRGHQRVFAALVPAAASILLLGGSLVVDLAFSMVRHHSNPPLGALLWIFTGYLIGWTILPAFALLLGATPVLVHAETSHGVRT